MPRHHDGEEHRMDAELVFVFVEEDRSVGISGGWSLLGVQVGRQLLEVSEVRGRFTFDDTNQITKLADALSEE